MGSASLTRSSIGSQLQWAAGAIVLLTVLLFASATYLLVVVPAEDDLAANAMQLSATKAVERVQALVHAAEHIAHTAREWGARGLLSVENPQQHMQMIIPLVRARSEITAVLLAREDGREILLLKTGEGWNSRFTDVTRHAGRQLWQLNTKAGQPAEEWRDSDYDPRKRPWFKGALALPRDDAAFWTEPYQFFSTKEPGITTATRWTDRATGLRHVTAFDIGLRDLSDMSARLSVGARGRVAILSADGRLLGLPRGDAPWTEAQARDLLLRRPSEATFPAISAALTQWETSGRPTATVFRRASGWMARVEAIPLGAQRILVIAVAPRGDFAIGHGWHVAAIGAILLVVLALALLLARHGAEGLAGSMRALAQASERIGNLELDRAVDVPARSRELQDLTAAQERMRQALLEATRGLEAKVGARTRELAEREADTRTLLDRQKAIFAASPYGIAVFQNRRFVEASPSFERMFGYEPGEVLGQSTRLLVASEDAFQQLWRGETERREHLLRRKDGSVFWCRITGRAVDPADPDQGSVWMVEDVTQERAAAEALREAKEAADTANRAKSSFLATMSHEIRTPMNGVFGMLELLSLSALDAEQRSTLASAHEAARSLLAIIDDILDVTKIEAGKLEIRPHAASLAATVEESFRVYTGAASAKGLTLRRRIDADLSPAVMIDALRLRQILNNFISNALKFTREGHVEIRAALVGRADGRETVCLSVADTGIGVSPENQKRLFEPFVQAEADTTRRFGGTGLGLTICRRLADLMGGEIEMVSAEGKGTTMRLTLTLDIADPAAIPRPEGATTGAGAPWARRAAPAVAQAERDGTLVLVADDHPLNRTLLVRQVNALGYACEAVDNGLQALEKLKSGRFGALITDCHMPEMDGYDLARAIRRLEAGGTRLPIIACTANALVGEADICRAAGMDDYIAKPVAMSELARALERWRPLPADLAAGGKGEPAGAAPIDRSVLAAVSDGDEGIERDMLLHYRAINASDAADLVGAIAAHDMAQVVRASHRMKGASRMVGAMALADVCEGIERAGRATDWGGVTACRDALSHELSRLDEYLQGL